MPDYIGSTLAVFAGPTAVESQSAYEANSYINIGKLVSVGELGDTHEDMTESYLDTGRVSHHNGGADGGEVPFSIGYDGSDAGLAALRAGNGGATVHTFRISDPDGEDIYFQGVIANLRDRERTTSAIKGFSWVVRVNTPPHRVSA